MPVEDETVETTQNQRFSEQHDICYVDFVWDVTYSGHVIGSIVRSQILSTLECMDKWHRDNPSKEFRVGLTLLQNAVRNGLHVDFGTTNDMRTALQNIEFVGGSYDGYEDLYAALDVSMEKLSRTEQHANCNVILISDSTVKEGTQQRRYENVGLRTSLIYVNLDQMQFRPAFTYVDGEGNRVETARMGTVPSTAPISVEMLWDLSSEDNLKNRFANFCANNSIFRAKN
ncbi:MAG: hypothetical protein LUE11_07080 [Clostridia bacterium]|nr:hypothetical protein [Clostridia bacterium]